MLFHLCLASTFQMFWLVTIKESVDTSKKMVESKCFPHCHWNDVMGDRDAIVCPQLSLGAGNNNLCPFQIPSRKAIAHIGGMLTLLVTAVPLVFDGLLLKPHPRTAKKPWAFYSPRGSSLPAVNLHGWSLQFKSSVGPGNYWRSLKLTLEQDVSDNRTREKKKAVQTAVDKDDTLLCGFVFCCCFFKDSTCQQATHWSAAPHTQCLVQTPTSNHCTPPCSHQSSYSPNTQLAENTSKLNISCLRYLFH